MFRVRRPRPNTAAAPPLRGSTGRWLPFRYRQRRLISPTGLRFLSVDGDLDDVGWDGPQRPKLWRFNQHYFDDLIAADAELRRNWHQALIQRWIRDNTPGISVGWEPYPCSLRIVNWVKWQLAGGELSADAVHSLAIQARWLRKRIEWHLLGNHLLANAKALVFAGTFFRGGEAESWQLQGLSILRQQLREQVLEDGAHFERSPMYHALILEDVLDLIALAKAYPDVIGRSEVIVWEEVAGRMMAWLRSMTHPDGEIAFFNDATGGVAAAPALLLSYFRELALTEAGQGVPGPASGFLRMERGSAVAFLDVGSVGPDYQPGHAHAGTLSFELSQDGRRLVVNSGISEYGLGRVRAYERSTPAHSTVQVGYENSSQVWGGFRVAARARVSKLQNTSDGHASMVSCCHDGYRTLKGRPLHCRTWRLTAREFRVTDRVSDSGQHAVARFHFHPDLSVTAATRGGWHVTRPDSGLVVNVRVESGKARVEPGHYSPGFGIRLSNSCLAVELADGKADVVFTFASDADT